MAKTTVDNLAYIDDYIDILEALHTELQKNFTLLKEMDGYAQESTSLTAKAAIDLIDTIDTLDANDRFTQLKNLITLLEETVQRSSEKSALAKVTLDAVRISSNADLVKFEENQPIGSQRIITLPGLAPSSRSLREYSKLSIKEKNIKKGNDKRELQQSNTKKRRVTKEDIHNIPRTKSNKPPSPTRKNSSNTKLIKSEMHIDPNEPLYCYCNQVSYGEMVACDNMNCEIEWFHLACVNLKTVPKGKWYCDYCTKYKGKQK
ncbi:uncharacterized protein BX663DRAFT_487983 [Cokeromyces recurvatus]|uniref:uncharacterized protein n=1 Tax=Cokeromyces recurvatus TaxID=90255 RepID=UPI002220D27F|nr:uncharacterized protein BX663DRAFT_487983 [Cokeromyces recurvatus]KAI7901011.1 hypothetical protein BX663DRAFT_487983 [Cokeromyces recurvatus]